MFGCPKSAKKMRESEEKKKRAGKRELKASQKFIAMLIDCHFLHNAQKKGKLQNNMKQQNYSEGRKEKNQNGVIYIKNRGNNFRYA